MKFIRIIKTKKTSDYLLGVPQDIKKLKFIKGANIPSDCLFGFETKNNTLSLFSFNNQAEKERILAHCEVLRTQLHLSAQEINYIEFDSKYLKSLNIKYKLSPMKTYLDNIVTTNHYDIINLDSNLLTHIIFNINKDISNKNFKIFTEDKISLLSYIKKYHSLGILDLNNNYKQSKINDFFNK